MSNQSELTEDDIPLNIRHKFGKETVLMLIRENNREVMILLFFRQLVCSVIKTDTGKFFSVDSSKNVSLFSLKEH